MDPSEDISAVVSALCDQVGALLPQARARLGEARHAEIAGRTDQIRHEASRRINAKTLVEDKAWLDQTLAQLLGLVEEGGRPSAG